MKLTLQTQLFPNADQAAKLQQAVERFNEAADWLAGIAFERRLANKCALQKIAYKELRERFGLPADMAIRCIAQVVEAYKRDKDVRPRFRTHAAVPYSMGKNIGFKGPGQGLDQHRWPVGSLWPSSWERTRRSGSACPRGSATSCSGRTASGSCW